MTSCIPEHIFFFFFNDTATTEIYTLSLHDALPISSQLESLRAGTASRATVFLSKYGEKGRTIDSIRFDPRSEEHTSELQSRQYLVCRLLLEKKKSILMVHTGDTMQPAQEMDEIGSE